MKCCPENTGLAVCPTSVLGYTEASTDQYSFSGKILSGQTWDFTPVINQPYWALGFEMLGKQYDLLGLQCPEQYFAGVTPNANVPSINAQQALYYTSLRVYNCAILNSTTAQMSDVYATPTGIVKTQWTVGFNHSAKMITVSNLMTQLPQGGGFRACTEVLLAFWRPFIVQFPEAVAQVNIPYTI